MAANPTALIRRAPRWAWITAGGIAIGGATVYTVKNRAKPEETSNAPTDTDLIGSPPTQLWDSSPVPGIVVPPIVTPGTSEPGSTGWLELHNLYIGATQETVSTLNDAFKTILGGQQSAYDRLQENNQSLIGLISQAPLFTGGGAPNGAAPPGAVAVPAAGPTLNPALAVPSSPATPAAAACPPAFPNRSINGCYHDRTFNACTCSGTGKNRRCWTNRHTHRVYSNGREVGVSVDYLRAGC